MGYLIRFGSSLVEPRLRGCSEPASHDSGATVYAGQLRGAVNRLGRCGNAMGLDRSPVWRGVTSRAEHRHRGISPDHGPIPAAFCQPEDGGRLPGGLSRADFQYPRLDEFGRIRFQGGPVSQRGFKQWIGC